MKEKFTWKIECNHTPETIDRIMMPIRKRGLSVVSFNYKQSDAKNAVCMLEVEVEEAETEKIYKNMIRIHDIQSVTKV